MKVKNDIVYKMAIILFIWNILYIYLSRYNFSNIINFIFWIIMFLFCYIHFNKEYKRDKYKSIIFKDVLIFILLYLIIYYLLGFVVGFMKSPLSFSIINIFKSLFKYVLLKGVIECVKFYLIKENNSKIFIVFITLIFIIFSIDVRYLVSLFDDFGELFIYISGTVIPVSVFGIVGTYIIKMSDLKTNFLLQIPCSAIAYIVPFAPNLDWYFYSMYNIIFLLGLYLFVRYDIDKREKTIKVARSSLGSMVPGICIFLIAILFVLGVFNYVPLGVMSNSMKPYFQRGDIVVYEKISNIYDIKINDVICYQLREKKVMHRVVKIDNINGNIYFTTKGDNLSTNDPLKVEEKQVIGTIKFYIPKMGYPSVWLYELLR